MPHINTFKISTGSTGTKFYLTNYYLFDFMGCLNSHHAPPKNRLLALLSRTLSDLPLAVIFSRRKRKKTFQVSHDTVRWCAAKTKVSSK